MQRTVEYIRLRSALPTTWLCTQVSTAPACLSCLIDLQPFSVINQPNKAALFKLLPTSNTSPHRNMLTTGLLCFAISHHDATSRC